MAKAHRTLSAEEPRIKVYKALDIARNKYHIAPLTEGPNGVMMPHTLVFTALTYLLGRNQLLVGNPGWGKTTSAKIIASLLSGVPYDLYDALEIRGNPQKYEEKIVGRPHLGDLTQKGIETVIWQGSFGLPVLNVDEGNRLPLDSQDVILQGIDTGRWNYMNQSLYEGKKPVFITMNERTGNHENGFLPALKDRCDVVVELRYTSSMDLMEYSERKDAVEQDLVNPAFVGSVLQALSRSYADFKRALEKGSPISQTALIPDETRQIISQMEALALDADARLFLQAFDAEINFSSKYGCKRVEDPISDDTHDKQYAGVNVRHTFSPRSAMAAIDYARAIAWFVRDSQVRLDHVRYVLPYIYAHKADFTPDYRDAHANSPRIGGACESISLAHKLVADVHSRYTESVQLMKNFILDVREGTLSDEELAKLREQDYDHPLMKVLIRELKAPERAFYESDD